MNTRVVIACLAVLVGLAAGFYGGYSFGQAHASTRSGSGAALAGAGGGNAVGGGGTLAGLRSCPSPRPSGRSVSNRNRGAVTGTISLLTPSGFTVDNSRCGTQTKVTFAPSVTVVKTVTGSTSDLANNDNVIVIGSRESDGSIQATTIEITPAGTAVGGFGGFGGGSSTGSTTG